MDYSCMKVWIEKQRSPHQQSSILLFILHITINDLFRSLVNVRNLQLAMGMNGSSLQTCEKKKKFQNGKRRKRKCQRHNEFHYRVFSVLCLLKHGLSHFLHTLSLSKTFIYYPEAPTSKRVFSVVTLSLSQNMKIPCFSCFSPSTTEKNNNNGTHTLIIIEHFLSFECFYSLSLVSLGLHCRLPR